MAIDSWSTRSAAKPLLLRAFDPLLETKEHESDANSHYERHRIRTQWIRNGVDEATARWHAMTYRGQTVAERTAAGSTGYLLTNGVPVAGASSVHVDGFYNDSSHVLYQGWHFMIWDDPTIYTLSQDCTVSTRTELWSEGAVLGWMVLDTANEYIYYGLWGGAKIRRRDFDGSNVTDIQTGLDSPMGIAIDVSNSYIYWAEGGATQKIRRSAIGGGAVTDLVTGLNDPRGLDLDLTNSHIYWVSKGDQKVRRCNLDGSGPTDIVTGLGAGNGYDLKLDVAGGKIYYSDTYLKRCDLAGTNGETVNSTYDLIMMALDNTNDEVYVCDQSADTISKLNQDGTGDWENLVTSANDPHGIAIDSANNTLYYTNDDNKCYRTSMCGGPQKAELVVTPVISAAAAALGDNVPVHFLIPQETGAPYAHPSKVYNITQNEEFATPWTRVYQPVP